MARPTKKQRSFQIRADKLMQKIERPFARAIAREKNRFIKQYVRNYLIGIKDNLIGREQHNNNITEIYRFYVGKTIRIFGKAQEKMLKSATVLEMKKQGDLFDTFLDDYMLQFGFNKAATISATTNNDMKAVLRRWSDSPITDKELAAQLSAVTKLSAARAATIARTETHAAGQFAFGEIGNFIEATLDVVMMKAWIPSLDERTRETHAEMDSSNYISIHEAFVVGGESLMYPSDPAGSPENVINCRCVMVQEER